MQEQPSRHHLHTCHTCCLHLCALLEQHPHGAPQRLFAYASIRQHTSADVSRRQQT
jgi:hypothetical protein